MPALSEYCRDYAHPSIDLSITATMYDVKRLLHNNYFTVLRIQDQALENNMAAKSKIISLRDLPTNWDSEGALRISENSIRNSTMFVDELTNHGNEVYFVSPGPEGEISVELKNNGKSAEVIFYGDGGTNFLLFDNKTFVNQGSLTETSKQELLNWLNA